MILHAYIDGASRGNPGESGVGIVLKDERGNLLYAEGHFLGKGTNNAAEYAAFLRCLKRAKTFRCQKLVVHCDSELLVRQFNGEYKIKSPDLKKEMAKARKIMKSLTYPIEVRYIPREKNVEADRLANTAIDHQIKHKI
jgi:ribonuclease HI